MGDWADDELDNAYSSDDPWDEDKELEIDDLDEWVFDCGDPNCCMPGPHFRHECHTPEMIEAQIAEAEAERATEPQGGYDHAGD